MRYIFLLLMAAAAGPVCGQRMLSPKIVLLPASKMMDEDWVRNGRLAPGDLAGVGPLVGRTFGRNSRHPDRGAAHPYADDYQQYFVYYPKKCERKRIIHDSGEPIPGWKNGVKIMIDGGPCFFSATISLTWRTLYYFRFNGNAC